MRNSLKTEEQKMNWLEFFIVFTKRFKYFHTDSIYLVHLSFQIYFSVAAGLPPGGFDLGGLLNNPMLMNMATSMLADPNMQRMMGQIMSGGMMEAGGPNNMEGLLEA